MTDPQISIIAHNIRSTHNIGALFRLADGMGVSHIYLTGYTPYPMQKNDTRLPHIVDKLHHQITKTALGAEATVPWSHHSNLTPLIHRLKSEGNTLIGLEQHSRAQAIHAFEPPARCTILLGSEVEGIDPKIISQCDTLVEIPMYGKKESHNVITATAIFLAHCRLR